MKVFISADNSCDVNYQHIYIRKKIEFICDCDNSIEIVEEPGEADAIIFASTCTCTEYNLKYTIEGIKKVLQEKKKGAKTYLTGCFAREFTKPELTPYREFLEKNIDYIIPMNDPELVVHQVTQKDYNDDPLKACWIKGPFFSQVGCIYLSSGCRNRCSFCKTTFQNFNLESLDLATVKKAIDFLDSIGVSHVQLIGTNIAQYGLDTKGQFLLPEVVEHMESKSRIQSFDLVGFAFKDAIKANFADTLSQSQKLRRLSGGLESGSNRILKLMRKGFTSEQFIEFIERVRVQPKIKLDLNIMAGFPTEKDEDVDKTLEVLDSIKDSLLIVNICRYLNSSFVDSNAFTQLDRETIQSHAERYQKELKRREIRNRIVV